MCENQNWNMEWIKDISKIIENLLINPQVCIGFNMHLTEVFLEELAKVYSFKK